MASIKQPGEKIYNAKTMIKEEQLWRFWDQVAPQLEPRDREIVEKYLTMTTSYRRLSYEYGISYEQIRKILWRFLSPAHRLYLVSPKPEPEPEPEEEKKPHGNTGRTHENYYTGKKMDLKKFEYWYNVWQHRGCTKEEFAKLIGITTPTLNKHLATLFATGELKGVFTNPNARITIRMD